MLALVILLGIGSLVCWILVLIKIFQSQQIGLGILGIICPLFTFIYGWVKSDEWKIKQIMIIWTVLIVANLILQFSMPHRAVIVTNP